jgi:hypothetical protein
MNELRPYPHPGKFEGGLMIDEVVYDLSMDGADDECGSVDEHGRWYGLVRAPISLSEDEAPDLTGFERDYLRSLGGGAILTENSQGFVNVEYYETTEAIEQAWQSCQNDFSDSDIDPSDSDDDESDSDIDPSESD